ncbi:MAG: 30S ribosomal protein S4e [Pyrodictiaceae archaeon]
MARMGGRRHLKTLAAPKFWPVRAKVGVFTVKPSPGPHPINRSIPLLILVRDVFGYAKTAREARRLIAEGHFKIDGRVRRNYKYPVGFMDVIEIVDTGEKYRVLPYPIRFFTLQPIDDEEARFKIARIEDKSTVKGGHIQLHLHDGRNILIRVSDPVNPPEAKQYMTLGTVKFTLPEQQLVDYAPLQEGSLAIVFGGRNIGRVGRIISIHRGIRRYRSIVTLEDARGDKFQTSLDYVFVIAPPDSEPWITLPEGAWK